MIILGGLRGRGSIELLGLSCHCDRKLLPAFSAYMPSMAISAVKQECYKDVAFTEPRDVISAVVATFRIIVSHANLSLLRSV